MISRASVFYLASLLLLFSPFYVFCAPQPSEVGIGGNVDWFCGACDYYEGAVFVNAMKQSRKFGTFGSAWDTTNFTYNDIGLPVGKSEFGALIFDSLATPLPDTAGVWTIRATGANVTFVYSRLNHCCSAPYNWSYDPVTKVSVANFNCTADCVALDMDFRVNSGEITNLEAIRPGYPIDNYPTFTNAYMEIQKGFNNHRFMDWAATNGNSVREWNERTPLNALQYTNGKGIPWECVIELSNTAGTNMWVNIPSNATDDYILQMAKLFKDTVDSNLIVYLEFSNEPWNSGFQVTQDSYKIGPALYYGGGYDFLDYDNSSNIWYMGYRWTVWRAYTASNIWRSVWGDAAMNTKVRVIINGQLWSIWATVGLGMIDTVFGPPSNYFYALAVAPYFNMQNSTLDSTEDSVWEQMDLGSKSIMSQITDNMVLAHRYGLELLCYEGGADVGTGTNSTNRALVSSDPRMTGTVQNYLVAMLASGVRLFNYYFVGMNTFSGSNDWGVLASMTDLTAPKYVGIRNVLNAGKSDYEYTYAPPPGLDLITADWLFVPQSEMGWPTAWDLNRWQNWQHALGEQQQNGAYYNLTITYSVKTDVSFTVKLNNKDVCDFTLKNSSGLRANATVCTILTVPRTNVFFFNITNFPNPSGNIYFVEFSRTAQQAPTFTWGPMSYAPDDSSEANSTTGATSASSSVPSGSTSIPSSTTDNADKSDASSLVHCGVLVFLFAFVVSVLGC